MKNTIRSLLFIIATLIAVFSLLISCDSKKAGKDKEIVVSHEFPDWNWAFEEEELTFEFPISDTTKEYQIALLLKYDTAVATLKNIPLYITLNTPDGMRSVVSSQFKLDREDNSLIRSYGSGSEAEVSVVVFPKRKLRTSGKYSLVVYRKAEKADNYGYKELSAKITPM